jgi:hypothetical protein
MECEINDIFIDIRSVNKKPNTLKRADFQTENAFYKLKDRKEALKQYEEEEEEEDFDEPDDSDKYWDTAHNNKYNLPPIIELVFKRPATDNDIGEALIKLFEGDEK